MLKWQICDGDVKISGGNSFKANSEVKYLRNDNEALKLEITELYQAPANVPLIRREDTVPHLPSLIMFPLNQKRIF
jgi:hypothetical protein